MHRYAFITIIVSVFLSLSLHSGRLFACSEYVHLWRPVHETRSSVLCAEGVAVFIERCLGDLAEKESRWLVAVNPESGISTEFTDEIKRGVALLDQNKFYWADSLSPFEKGGCGSAAIWLDFINPERLVYIWADHNRPPFAMIRTGEIDTAKVRVLAISSAGKILLIDELPHMFLLESDFMLPTWISNGGVWFRRLSFKTAQMTRRHEWTVAVPPDPEEINQTPSDVRCFYYGETPAGNIKIFSNY